MVARNLGSTGSPGGTDSAGVPWQGRHFEESTWDDDDGAAPELLLEALRRFRAGELGQVDVLDAVRESRLLVPHGLEGAIVGKALYAEAFTLAEALDVAGD